jgi:hypothetical protein
MFFECLTGLFRVVRVDRELETGFFALIDLVVEGRRNRRGRLVGGGVVARRPRWLGGTRLIGRGVAALSNFDRVGLEALLSLLLLLVRSVLPWRLRGSLALLGVAMVEVRATPNRTCANRQGGKG